MLAAVAMVARLQPNSASRGTIMTVSAERVPEVARVVVKLNATTSQP